MFVRELLPPSPLPPMPIQPVVIIDEQCSTDEDEDDAFVLVKIIYSVLFAVIECVCGVVTVFGIPDCTAGGIYQIAAALITIFIEVWCCRCCFGLDWMKAIVYFVLTLSPLFVTSCHDVALWIGAGFGLVTVFIYALFDAIAQHGWLLYDRRTATTQTVTNKSGPYHV